MIAAFSAPQIVTTWRDFVVRMTNLLLFALTMRCNDHKGPIFLYVCVSNFFSFLFFLRQPRSVLPTRNGKTLIVYYRTLSFFALR
jgi:hypothetical protein